MNEKIIIAIDLGGTSVKLACVTPAGEVLNKWTIGTNILEEGQHIVPDIIASIKEYMEMHTIELSDVVGIGMGSPGKVDAANGTVIGAYNLNWRDLQNVKAQFNESFDVPFFIDNDANVAALGEQWQGAGKGTSDAIMVTLGTGVGGGIVVDHHLVRGAGSAAGEIGHMTVEVVDPFECTCGKKGCLETVASATGIMKLARRHSEQYTGLSSLKTALDNGDEVTTKTLFDAAKAGDPFAEEVVGEFAQYLGLACGNLANILNPATIMIGGGVSAAGEYLLEKVTPYYQEYTMAPVREVTTLSLATLGNDAGIIGAAQLVNLGLEK